MNDYQLSEMAEGYPKNSKFLLEYGLFSDMSKYVSPKIYVVIYDGIRAPVGNAVDSVKISVENNI